MNIITAVHCRECFHVFAPALSCPACGSTNVLVNQIDLDEEEDLDAEEVEETGLTWHASGAWQAYSEASGVSYWIWHAADGTYACRVLRPGGSDQIICRSNTIDDAKREAQNHYTANRTAQK